jgi:hypothetical protein
LPGLPAPVNAIPPLNSEFDLLRLCAAYCAEGPIEVAFMSRNLPRCAREMLCKRGGLRFWLWNYRRRWFRFSDNPRSGAQNDMIEYVGHRERDM